MRTFFKVTYRYCPATGVSREMEMEVPVGSPHMSDSPWDFLAAMIPVIETVGPANEERKVISAELVTT
jgi:hypothetical protein